MITEVKVVALAGLQGGKQETQLLSASIQGTNLLFGAPLLLQNAWILPQ